MKNFFRDIHLYLGLAAGLVIAVVCATGGVLVFEKEWQMSLYPERYYVSGGGASVPLSLMQDNLRKAVPSAKISSIKVYADPGRSVEIQYRPEKKGAGQAGSKKKALAEEGQKGGGPGREGTGQTAFFNPHSGQLIAASVQRSKFFFAAFSLHRWLLAGDTGKMIVGVSTLIFLVILITGIILWWPKTRKILRKRLTMKWDAGWKRINHDLHIVIGFYTAIFLFAFAFTGLAWSFKWFNDGIYAVTGTPNKPPKPPVSLVVEGAERISFDAVLEQVKRIAPSAEYYTLNAPKKANDAFAVSLLPKDAAHERATTQVYFDQYSGKFLSQLRFSDRNLGQRVRTTFYPVHVGSIAGLPGRIIAFLSCIAGATFPITGIILWINRIYKKPGKKRVANIPSRQEAAMEAEV